MTVGIALRALDDAAYCGDLCAAWENGTKVTLCMADGPGHGQAASKASTAAVEYVADCLDQSLGAIFKGCDRAVSSTRGTAMAIAVADLDSCQPTYAGIGNTRCKIFGKNEKTLSGNYGIVGAGFKKLVPETVPFCADDIAVFRSDGMPEDIDLSDYPANLLEHPQSLAETILHNFSLGTDNTGVLAFRHP